MGYDMYYRSQPEEVLELQTKAWVSGEQQEWRAYFEAREEANVYFRLNIFGMAEFRTLLLNRGVAVWPDAPVPSFPSVEHYGVSYDELDAMETLEGEQLEKAMRFVTANERVRAWASPADRINLHKFTSNDGWIVTPGEIMGSLGDGVDEYVREGDPELWREFLEWMESAYDWGGFEVW